jgi:hypothetical protein
VTAGVHLAVTEDHTDNFGVILHRTPSDLSLLLFSEDKKDLAVALTAPVNFGPGTKLDFNTALFSYHFDVSKPGAINNGYNLAMHGDFVGVLAVDGVSLDPGTLLDVRLNVELLDHPNRNRSL